MSPAFALVLNVPMSPKGSPSPEEVDAWDHWLEASVAQLGHKKLRRYLHPASVSAVSPVEVTCPDATADAMETPRRPMRNADAGLGVLVLLTSLAHAVPRLSLPQVRLKGPDWEAWMKELGAAPASFSSPSEHQLQWVRFRQVNVQLRRASCTH